MNTEYELKAKYLQLKNFLSGVSDISYAFGILKEEARRTNVPLEQQVATLEDLMQKTILLITNSEYEKRNR